MTKCYDKNPFLGKNRIYPNHRFSRSDMHGIYNWVCDACGKRVPTREIMGHIHRCTKCIHRLVVIGKYEIKLKHMLCNVCSRRGSGRRADAACVKPVPFKEKELDNLKAYWKNPPGPLREQSLEDLMGGVYGWGGPGPNIMANIKGPYSGECYEYSHDPGVCHDTLDKT